MKRLVAVTCLFCFSSGNLFAEATEKEKSGPPKVGEMAPDFVMTGSDGKEYKLSQFKGKSGVIIAWYPKAFTGG